MKVYPVLGLLESSPKKEINAGGRLLPWIAVAVWAALIFIFSSQPSLQTGLGFWDFVLRKLAHVGEYVLLTLLIWNAVRRYRLGAKVALALAATGSLLYAASDEFHQTFIEGRNGTPRDVAIDAIGIVVAVLMILIFRPKIRHRVEKRAA